jgi:5-hmdU DNA kinase-like protein
MMISKIKDPVERLFAFAKERHSIYLKKEAGEKPPWTTDPILRDYRFCCVYRELDKVTKWIRENWREPHADDPDLWFAMCVARLLNRPETLEHTGYPVPFPGYLWARKLTRYQDEGNKIFNAAYIVSTNGLMIKKIAYIYGYVIEPLWKSRERLRPKKDDSLNGYHMLLGQFQGFGNFMTAQVIADLKYHEPLNSAPDWHTFAASGPGSRRGLNYVLGRERRSPWQEDEWRLELNRLREKIVPMFSKARMPVPHNQDLQNLLCEYGKMHRAMYEGKMPKQIYRWQETK